MGRKSRSNWRINFCMRFDCKNKNDEKKCNDCSKFEYYEPIPPQEVTEEKSS